MITKFENMVQDTLDSDFAYQLLNDAKDEVEAMQVWEQKKKAQEYTVTSGYSYTSALGALPTRFALDIRAVEGTSNIDLEKVAFDDLNAKANATFGYFLDLANDNLYLAGSNHSGKTITLFYTDYSADLTASDTWVFPSRFHSIIPLKMAELYYAADAGEKRRAWDDRWSAQYERALIRMKMWNDSLKVRNKRTRGNRTNPAGINV